MDKVRELISSRRCDLIGWGGYQMKAAGMKEKQNNVIVSSSLRDCFQASDKRRREGAR